MTCFEVGNRVAPGFHALLDPTDRAAVDAHIAACPDCRARRSLVESAVAAGPALFDVLDGMVDAAAGCEELPGFGGHAASEADGGDPRQDRVVSLDSRRAPPRVDPPSRSRRMRWIVPLVALAAAALFLLRPPEMPRHRGAAADLGLELALASEGARRALVDPLNLDDVIVFTVHGSPGARAAVWVAVGDGPPVRIDEVTLDPDGATELERAWRVTEVAVHAFFVTDAGEVPVRDAAGRLLCGDGPCAITAEAVR